MSQYNLYISSFSFWPWEGVLCEQEFSKRKIDMPPLNSRDVPILKIF